MKRVQSMDFRGSKNRTELYVLNVHVLCANIADEVRVRGVKPSSFLCWEPGAWNTSTQSSIGQAWRSDKKETREAQRAAVNVG